MSNVSLCLSAGTLRETESGHLNREVRPSSTLVHVLYSKHVLLGQDAVFRRLSVMQALQQKMEGK